MFSLLEYAFGCLNTNSVLRCGLVDDVTMEIELTNQLQ